MHPGDRCPWARISYKEPVHVYSNRLSESPTIRKHSYCYVIYISRLTLRNFTTYRNIAEMFKSLTRMQQHYTQTSDRHADRRYTDASHAITWAQSCNVRLQILLANVINESAFIVDTLVYNNNKEHAYRCIQCRHCVHSTELRPVPPPHNPQGYVFGPRWRLNSIFWLTRLLRPYLYSHATDVSRSPVRASLKQLTVRRQLLMTATLPNVRVVY